MQIHLKIKLFFFLLKTGLTMFTQVQAINRRFRLCWDHYIGYVVVDEEPTSTAGEKTLTTPLNGLSFNSF